MINSRGIKRKYRVYIELALLTAVMAYAQGHVNGLTILPAASYFIGRMMEAW